MDLSKLESGQRVLRQREETLTKNNRFVRPWIVKYFIDQQQSRSTFEPEDGDYSESAFVPLLPVETPRGQREARLFLWASDLLCREGVKVYLEIGRFEPPATESTRQYLGTVDYPVGNNDSGLRYQESDRDPAAPLPLDERILIDGLLFEAAEIAGFDPYIESSRQRAMQRNILPNEIPVSHFREKQ